VGGRFADTDGTGTAGYRLRVFPTATGQGRRLFPDGRELDLVRIEQMGPTWLVVGRPSR
jgi:hypothetical protein